MAINAPPNPWQMSQPPRRKRRLPDGTLVDDPGLPGSPGTDPYPALKGQPASSYAALLGGLGGAGTPVWGGGEVPQTTTRPDYTPPPGGGFTPTGYTGGSGTVADPWQGSTFRQGAPPIPGETGGGGGGTIGTPAVGTPPVGKSVAQEAPPPVARTQAPAAPATTGTGVTPSATPPPGHTDAEKGDGQWGRRADGTWVITYPNGTVSTVPTTAGGTQPAGTTGAGETPGDTGPGAGGIFDPGSPLNNPEEAVGAIFAKMGINPYASTAGALMMRRARDLMYSTMGRQLGASGFSAENPGLGMFNPGAANEQSFRDALQAQIQSGMQGGQVFGSSYSRPILEGLYNVMNTKDPYGGAGTLASYFADPDAGERRVSALVSALTGGGGSDFMRQMQAQRLSVLAPQWMAGQNQGNYANLLGYLLNQGRGII